MTERDEEHRPKATRNAGAFFSPSRGPTPLPTDIESYWEHLPVSRSLRRLARNVIIVIAVVALVLIALWVLTPAAASALLVAG